MKVQEDVRQLREFVAARMREGADEAQLREVLAREGGWSQDDLNTIFAQVKAAAQRSPLEPAQPVVPRGEVPTEATLTIGSTMPEAATVSTSFDGAAPAAQPLPGPTAGGASPAASPPLHLVDPLLITQRIGVVLIGFVTVLGVLVFIRHTRPEPLERVLPGPILDVVLPPEPEPVVQEQKNDPLVEQAATTANEEAVSGTDSSEMRIIKVEGESAAATDDTTEPSVSAHGTLPSIAHLAIDPVPTVGLGPGGSFTAVWEQTSPNGEYTSFTLKKAGGDVEYASAGGGYFNTGAHSTLAYVPFGTPAGTYQLRAYVRPSTCVPREFLQVIQGYQPLLSEHDTNFCPDGSYAVLDSAEQVTVTGTE